MFQSLASYFYGSTSDNDDQTVNSVNGSSSSSSSSSSNSSSAVVQNALPLEKTTRLVTKPCDEHNDEDETEVSDWLLVDKEDSPVQTDSEDEIHIVEIKNNPIVPYRRNNNHRQHHHQQQHRSGGNLNRNHSGGIGGYIGGGFDAGTHDGLFSLSPASLLPSSMDESWFVTPPPCFTSVGPVSMEMSPFENLLIEHPSMSVYHSMRRSQTAIDDEDDLIVVDLSATGPSLLAVGVGNAKQHRSQSQQKQKQQQQQQQQQEQAVVQQQLLQQQNVHVAVVERNSPIHTAVRVRGDGGRPNVSHRTIKQLLSSNTQKNHNHKPNTGARNAMERGNKVREVNSKGGRQKRSDMNHSKVLSRANNNRKQF